MIADCSTIATIAKPLSLVSRCDIIKSGALRILTPFSYPDGSQIDLFLEEPQPLFSGHVLSDLGQTTTYLLDANVKPGATNKRRQIIEDVCQSLNVKWQLGKFMIELSEHDLDDITPLMMRLGQACIRVSDLAYSARLSAAGGFRDEIEEFLESIDLPREKDVLEHGTGGEVKIDFRVRGEHTVSLIQTVSAASAFSGKHAINAATVKWLDLDRRKDVQKVTLIDESHDVFQTREIDRLERFSTVLAFPTEQEQLVALIAA